MGRSDCDEHAAGTAARFCGTGTRHVYQMSERFAGRTVLVTGGTGGLGRAVALAFVEESANVIVTYRKQEEFEALPGNPRVEGFSADVTDEDAVHELVKSIL